MKKQKKLSTDKYEHLDLCNAACATECTGLIQVWPLSDDEAEAYNQVYHYQPPEVKPPKNKA